MNDYQVLWQVQKDWLQEQIDHCKEEQEKYAQLYQDLGKDSELGAVRMFAAWQDAYQRSLENMQERERQDENPEDAGGA